MSTPILSGHTRSSSGSSPNTTATTANSNTSHFDVSQWEKKSKLSIDQTLLLNNLQTFIISERPLPQKQQELLEQKRLKEAAEESEQQEKQQQQQQQANESSLESESGTTTGSLKSTTQLPDKAIDSLADFYDWLKLIEKTSTHLHQYEWFLETIVSYGQGTDELQAQVQDCETLINSIQTDYFTLTKKTSQLHDSCEKFFKEELRLRYIVHTIHEKLRYYLELDQSTKKFNSSSFTVTDPNFMSSLETLEDCIQFMKKNVNFQGTSKYVLQYTLLFQRALGLIKDYISASFKIITKEILTSMKDIDSDFQISNIKFRAFAPKLRPLCLELEKRAVGQYVSYIRDCHSIYFKNRKLILTPIITLKLQELTKSLYDTTPGNTNNANVPSLVQNLCIYMVQIFENEYQIYIDFFDKQTANFNELLDEYAQQLYDTVRPVYIHIHSFEELCNLAHLIRNEILDDIIEQSTRYCNGLRLAVQRMLQDIQERLLFLIQTFIRDEIRTFSPSPADIDYPNHITKLSASGEASPKSMYSLWYPTLEKTLTCLSKLYLVVDTKIFEGLAQEAVEACTYTLIKASSLIATKQDNPFAITDSQLFLIKYFIVLREQITPFDINFVIIEKIVDFPNLKHALSTMYNYGSLFALSTNNPIYNVIASAANPRVTNTSIDSKKDLEKELKLVIESFILSTSNYTIDPLLTILTKISVYLNQSSRDNSNVVNSSLSQQPFAEPMRINETIKEVVKRIETYLPEIIARMKVYLSNMTQNLLMKPIRTNIADGFDQINQYAKRYYNEEQIKSMQLLSSEDLKTLLDKVIPIQLSIKTSTSGSNINSSSSSSLSRSSSTSSLTNAPTTPPLSIPVVDEPLPHQ
ncbi:oligomeric Golgi complex component [Heterostelium album PN500]|uniref:Conserved oligomeric Golgi complex subunit 3 n=1 Tax=Heterostelium pallidum (strain ATCC 26659 / Pp 5 / PN500) TaxID=670386 RepID=D3BE20_HETP5|nr:oligomeric Golgi complex component [Heterostelium album PN500]EFA80151.1 oligomeric Golgi complex component [Heterostelium album PN500]|eukprot:XP_020432271.1 oligomeric Golgi complex component [Heterostelium album PN500]